VFFTDCQHRRNSGQAVATALGYCRECPVAWDCLLDALSWGDEYGVRGGLTAPQRAPLHKHVTALRKGYAEPGEVTAEIRRGAEHAWAINRERIERSEVPT
jgi:hypothetical protein